MTEDDSDVTDDQWLTQALASLPTPPIPPEVAARVSAAIRVEAEARVDNVAPLRPPAEPPAPDSTGTTNRRKDPRRWLLGAGAVAAAGLVAAFVVNQITPDSSVPAAQPPVTASPEGGDARTQATAGSQPDRAGTDQVTFVQPVSSGTSYTAASLQPVMADRMHQLPTTPAPAQVRAATFAQDAAGIQSCLDGVGAKPLELRMIDLARYEDLPSAVMAFRGNDQDPTTDVIVVGMLCTRDHPQIRMRAQVNTPD